MHIDNDNFAVFLIKNRVNLCRNFKILAPLHAKNICKLFAEWKFYAIFALDKLIAG